MKKKANLKKFLAFALLAAGLFVSTFMYAKTTVAKVVVAWGCKYTGNSSDTCTYTYGGTTYSIYNCTPGSTSCGFNPIGVEEEFAE